MCNITVTEVKQLTLYQLWVLLLCNALTLQSHLNSLQPLQ